jgi:hypothetical protein
MNKQVHDIKERALTLKKAEDNKDDRQLLDSQ